MNALKQLFATIKLRAGLIAVAVLALAAFVIDLLSKRNTGLQAQVDEVKDQKTADVLESKVNEELSDANAKQADVNANQKTLDALAAKRAALPQQQNLSSQQVVDYWKNNP